MTLATGSRLGPYEIAAAIGAGGMGEVYRAYDTKLGRNVAIKVLPAGFSHDAECMARFQREAKLLASLNHFNIASIYGLEGSDGTQALVMELAEGPTLADRIHQGPLSIEDTLKISRQITDALEYAHERGIIHRDLKPTNVKVAADDTVKILDFGLAKAMEGEAASVDISTSPTITSMATEQGVLLGTAAYMAPEQAKGKPVDRRADIWAFGCVLYEMLTGKMTFAGETATDVLAAVLKNEPDWSKLPGATPTHVRVLLQRCLQKDPKQRLRDIGDARISLDEVLSGAPEGASGLAAPISIWRRALPWAVGVFAVAIAVAATWNLKPASTAPTQPVTRAVINLPPGDQLAINFPAIAISPDGTRLAYVAFHLGVRQIYLRALNSLDAQPLAGTEEASMPFFSPDGQWLGFAAGGKLKKISISGGTAFTLGNAPILRGASWSSQGMIVFSPTPGSALQEVPDAGGVSEPLTRLDKGEAGHQSPEFLPDGQEVLFETTGANPGIAVQSLHSGERRSLIPGGFTPSYASLGQLLYLQNETLMAAAFDPQKLQVTSAAIPVVENVLHTVIGNTSISQYGISTTGSLAYIPGSAQLGERLVWVSRNGTEQALSAPTRMYQTPRISPDGKRFALVVNNGDEQQIWFYDLTRDTLTKFSTFGGSLNSAPAWTSDGQRLAFASNREGRLHIFWQPADGSGVPEPLTTSEHVQFPRSFSFDGKLLAFGELNPTTGYDIWVLRLSDHTAQPFLRTPATETSPSFSPDGRWLAYVSDESGQFEVYVQPYPGPGGKYQISGGGGMEPVWNPNGKELFFREGDKMMAVDITTQSGFSAGKPRMLFQGNYLPTPLTLPEYDVSPDGQRFLMIKADQHSSSLNQIVLVQNWFEELQRKVSAGEK